MDNLQLKIEAYISNTMSKEESLAFEKEMQNNTKLTKEVNLAKQLNHFLTDEYIPKSYNDNILKEKFKIYLESDEAIKTKNLLLEIKKEYSNKSKKKNYYLIAASITILVFSLIIFNLFKNTKTNLYTQYFSVNDLPSVIKRNDTNNLFAKGVLAFKIKNYNDALAHFNAYKKQKNIDNSVYLYTSIAYTSLNKYQKALTEIDKIIAKNTIDKPKGLWFKALIYLKMEDNIKAKKILQQLIKNSNYKNLEAKKIVQEI